MAIRKSTILTSGLSVMVMVHSQRSTLVSLYRLHIKDFDFHADFSGAAGYSWYQNWEQRWAFQNNGNLNAIFKDRWHRADIYDLNSAWIPGKYPPTGITRDMGTVIMHSNSINFLAA